MKFAREKGYFEGKDADFSFQAAYAPFDFSALYVCEARVWSFFRHFSDDMEQYFDYATGKTFLETGGKDAGKPMPLYIRPNRKVSVQEIKDCMRDQYEGTPLDITQGTDAGPWNTNCVMVHSHSNSIAPPIGTSVRRLLSRPLGRLWHRCAGMPTPKWEVSSGLAWTTLPPMYMCDVLPNQPRSRMFCRRQRRPI